MEGSQRRGGIHTCVGGTTRGKQGVIRTSIYCSVNADVTRFAMTSGAWKRFLKKGTLKHPLIFG